MGSYLSCLSGETRKIIHKVARFLSFKCIFIAAPFVGFVYGSCNAVKTKTIVGSNTFIEKTFDLGSIPICSIELNSFGTLEIKPGERNSLTIKAEENLLDFFSPSLKNHKLSLGMSSNANISSHGVRYTLEIASFFEELTVSGSGKVQVTELNTPTFSCHISGSGKVVILAGEVGSQLIEASGSGRYLASNLKANHSTVNIRGSASADVQAVSTLSVKISGSGRCVYSGNPVLSSSISGSGEIIKK